MAEHLETAGAPSRCRLCLFLVGVLGQYSDPKDMEVGRPALSGLNSIVRTDSDWSRMRAQGGISCWALLLWLSCYV